MPSPSGKDATTLPSPVRWLVRSQGLFVIVSSLVAGILTWVILGLLVKIAKETDVRLPDLLYWCLGHRAWVALLAAPALACGIVAMLGGRMRWVWLIVAYTWLLVLLIVNLYCFLTSIAPWYQMQEL